MRIINKIKKTINKERGFTLVEILVVVLIIVAMSGILLGTLNSGGIRSKSRDNQRKADLRRIQTALELYYQTNRHYPGDSSWIMISSSSSVMRDLVNGNFIDSIPSDPSHELVSDSSPCTAWQNNRYNYRRNNYGYDLTAMMEVAASNDDSVCPANICTPNMSATIRNYCYYMTNP